MRPRPSLTAALAGIAIAALLLSGCHRTPRPGDPRLHGIQVRVAPGEVVPGEVVPGDDGPGRAGSGESAGRGARGELLAVSDDSLWVLVEAPRHVNAFPLQGTEVRPLDGGVLRPHLWATIGGGLTGVGLFVACQSYESGSGCVATIPIMLGMYHGLGLLARLFMYADRGAPLDVDPDRLRRFARFPAGLPPAWGAPMQDPDRPEPP